MAERQQQEGRDRDEAKASHGPARGRHAQRGHSPTGRRQRDGERKPETDRQLLRVPLRALAGVQLIPDLRHEEEELGDNGEHDR